MSEDPAPAADAPPQQPAVKTGWHAAYATARAPVSKSAEIIAALDFVITRDFASARACAALQGDVFDPVEMRRTAALEVAHDTFLRIAANWSEFSDKQRAIIAGTGPKKMTPRG